MGMAVVKAGDGHHAGAVDDGLGLVLGGRLSMEVIFPSAMPM